MVGLNDNRNPRPRPNQRGGFFTPTNLLTRTQVHDFMCVYCFRVVRRGLVFEAPRSDGATSAPANHTDPIVENMAHNILAVAGLPRNIEALTDAELVALCEEPEFLADCTPLELELIVRLGAALEVHSGIENESPAEICRLAQYEPKQVRMRRQKAASKALDVLISEMEAKPKSRRVRVAG